MLAGAAGVVAGAGVAAAVVAPAAGAAASAGLTSADCVAGTADCAGVEAGFLSQPATTVKSNAEPRTTNVLFMIFRFLSDLK